MAVLNLTKAEAFGLWQAMRIEASACREAIALGHMPHFDVARLVEKIADAAPARSDVAHLFKASVTLAAEHKE